MEITKDMEFDYSKPLEGKQMKQLQKDFNTPPPIGTDLDATPKPSSSSHKKSPVLPAPVAPAAPVPAAPNPQVPVMVMMIPPGLAAGAMPGMPGMPGMSVMQVMPQMMPGASPTGAGAVVPPGVMMMPMQPMQQMSPAHGGMRPVDAAMVGQAVMPRADPNQYGRFGMPDMREPAAAYPRTQGYSPNGQLATFRDLCSPTYQSSEAYNQYVRDIMNADGDEFQFS